MSLLRRTLLRSKVLCSSVVYVLCTVVFSVLSDLENPWGSRPWGNTRVQDLSSRSGSFCWGVPSRNREDSGQTEGDVKYFRVYPFLLETFTLSPRPGSTGVPSSPVSLLLDSGTRSLKSYQHENSVLTPYETIEDVTFGDFSSILP